MRLRNSLILENKVIYWANQLLFIYFITMKKLLTLSAIFFASIGLLSFAASEQETEKATLFQSLAEQIISEDKNPEAKKEQLVQLFSGCAENWPDFTLREACEIVYKKLSGEEEREQERLSMPAYSIREYKLVEVVDWDTIKVQDYSGNVESVRMIGIDAPEDSTLRYGYKECFGKEATSHLKEILEGNEYVQIEFDNTQWYYDKYNRLLWYLILNKENINKQMIFDWYAFEYKYNLPYNYERDFKRAEGEARRDSKWLWASTTCRWERWDEEKIKEKIKSNMGSNSYSSQSSYSTYSTSKWTTYKNSDWRTYITGERGGCYYINSNGNKTYVDRSFCSSSPSYNSSSYSTYDYWSSSSSSHTWHTGPRWWVYYINSKGNKVYKKRK